MFQLRASGWRQMLKQAQGRSMVIVGSTGGVVASHMKKGTNDRYSEEDVDNWVLLQTPMKRRAGPMNCWAPRFSSAHRRRALSPARSYQWMAVIPSSDRQLSAMPMR